MARLHYSERPASGDPQGLLFLCHGRGTDDEDLLPLADVLDPRRRLRVISPRAPFQLPGAPGYHWYAVRRVGYPDPPTFEQSLPALAELHDELWEQTGLGPEQTVLGGFSQGTVMSYALGLWGDRPPPAGVLALSGFIPSVEGWEPALTAERARTTKVLIAHGRRDQVIHVGFAREARQRLLEAGFEVTYDESEAAHHIDPRQLPEVQSWLATVLAR